MDGCTVIPDIIFITPRHLERGSWHPSPACPFALSRVVYRRWARPLMLLGGDGRFGPLAQFLPLLAAVAVGAADVEFQAGECKP